MDEAKKLAGDHPDQVDKGLDEVEQQADKRTGGKYGDQLQEGEEKVEGYLGADNQNNQQGQQIQ
jgi:hypothetical protein